MCVHEFVYYVVLLANMCVSVLTCAYLCLSVCARVHLCVCARVCPCVREPPSISEGRDFQTSHIPGGLAADLRANWEKVRDSGLDSFRPKHGSSES